MRRSWRTLIILYVFQHHVKAYSQNEYVALLDRFDVISYDKEKIIPAARSFKYNRTAIAVNITLDFKITPGNNLEWKIQAFKFYSNEYRHFPITLTINFCDILKRDEFGVQNLFSCGNLTQCPLKKASYHMCNWMLDYTKAPPHVPNGKFMAETVMYHTSDEIARFKAYFEITRKVKYPTAKQN